MAVKIRLTRTGGRNNACFRIVACDSRSPRDGRFIEILGWYDPNREGQNFELKLDKIEKWVGNGAQLSDTVASMVRRARRNQTTIDEPLEVPEIAEVVEVAEPEADTVEPAEEVEAPAVAEKAEEPVA
ncbi:MAG: 30S ribosomal protein S16 [Kiritimatiellae bacterium]|nr:30S ribosomal protein S16 [Kiritimatiellia bacterium]